jgi:hypothetical protein
LGKLDDESDCVHVVLKRAHKMCCNEENSHRTLISLIDKTTLILEFKAAKIFMLVVCRFTSLVNISFEILS